MRGVGCDYRGHFEWFGLVLFNSVLFFEAVTDHRNAGEFVEMDRQLSSFWPMMA